MISGIIGHPLKNPRSITIWKDFFKKNNIKSEMIKWDIDNSNFDQFMIELLNDQYFLATAVTMPYKKKALDHAEAIDVSAQSAQSTNLLIKKNNIITAYNTDVLGAEKSICSQISKFKNIIILGFGGTGEAIYRYFKEKYLSKKIIVISSKKINDNMFRKELTEKLISHEAIIVNCTPLGSDLSNEYLSKLPIDENLLNYINPNSLVFDIIYSPDRTKLFYECKKRNIKYINGKKMNTYQARVALELIFDAYK